jgi:RNA polymerase sigma factor (sigma-70 family)
VERSEISERSEGEEIASTRFPTSARLLSAIHRGEERAIRELFILYAPLLRDQARRMSIDADQRDELVTTLLDDVVLHLMEYRIAPRHLSKYLVAALRNRARNRHRDLRRRLATRERACNELVGSGERVVAEGHSAYGLAASDPHDVDWAHPPRSSIARMAERIVKGMSGDEITMLIRVGRHVPLREIADQLGISYGAARVRLHRLRQRLRKEAVAHVALLRPDERHELENFFRRAGVELAPRGVERQTERAHGKI